MPGFTTHFCDMLVPRKVGCYPGSKVFVVFCSLHGGTVYLEWRLFRWSGGWDSRERFVSRFLEITMYLHLSALNCRKFCPVQDVRLSMSDCNMARSSGVQIGLYIIISSAKSVMLPSDRVG